MKYRINTICTKSLLMIALVLWNVSCHAQEFFCSVTIIDSRIQGDKQVFDEMRRSISEYINDYKWTEDQFQHFERIRWQLRIIVNTRPTADQFRCTGQITAYRPIYGSTEETITLRISDPNFDFNYVPQQQMPHIDNTFQDNLTALLNFYAYIVLALDYDSFGENGGEVYYGKAQDMLNLATNSNETGWRSSDGQQNRYWLLENMTNTRYKAFHESMYVYHRQGLDQMAEDVNKGRTAVLESLRGFAELRRQNNLLYLLRIISDTKSTELINIFKGALPNQKQEFISIMEEVDPSKAGDYNSVMD